MTKISDLIKALNDLKEWKGDLPVHALDNYGEVRADVSIINTSTCADGEIVIITSGPQM